MKIRDLKAVIVDDAAVKSIHIKRALQFCGVENIVMFDHQEALWEYLETSEADLIVTDMHYPLAKGEKENEEAGFILLEKMKQREHPIPVIITALSTRFISSRASPINFTTVLCIQPGQNPDTLSSWIVFVLE